VLYDTISGGADASPINIDDIDLRDWGRLDTPYLIYYGHINANAIASWWEKYGNNMGTGYLQKILDITVVRQKQMMG